MRNKILQNIYMYIYMIDRNKGLLWFIFVYTFLIIPVELLKKYKNIFCVYKVIAVHKKIDVL